MLEKENRRPEPALNSTQNLVHPEWEIVDPTPNIHILKDQYDRKFFQGKLGSVELEWSKQMYKCAGICYQRSSRFGYKSCTIRLSEPLLSLRPRKDLVETLLVSISFVRIRTCAENINCLSFIARNDPCLPIRLKHS